MTSSTTWDVAESTPLYRRLNGDVFLVCAQVKMSNVPMVRLMVPLSLCFSSLCPHGGVDLSSVDRKSS